MPKEENELLGSIIEWLVVGLMACDWQCLP